MAEVDPLEHERTVDLLSGRHEAIEQTLERSTRGRMALGEPARDEQQQRPRRGRPTSLRPLAVGALVTE